MAVGVGVDVGVAEGLSVGLPLGCGLGLGAATAGPTPNPTNASEASANLKPLERNDLPKQSGANVGHDSSLS